MAESGPIHMEPGKEYVGLVCVNCHRPFPIAGPLETPPGQAVKIGARGPLKVDCPHCRHHASYPIEQLQRMLGPDQP